MSRRAFSRSLLEVVAGIAVLPPTVQARAQGGDSLGVAVVGTGSDEDFAKGVRMGIDEAARAASLFSKRISLSRIEPRDGETMSAAIERLSSAQVHALVAFSSADELSAMASACERHGIVLFNCGSRADSLRRNSCRSLFHIEASDAMYADAGRWNAAAKRIVLWDAGLEKYGAAQLNDRFLSAAGRPMTSSAWAGWLAVKIAWESFLRSPASIHAWLTAGPSQFDGHKGAPLSFRAWDRQLRQPLYATADRITEVPDLGRTVLPTRELLDTLGDGPGMQSCPAPAGS